MKQLRGYGGTAFSDTQPWKKGQQCELSIRRIR